MTVTDLIFTKIGRALQTFVENSCTEFHKNLTDGLVADSIVKDTRTDMVSA
jgi:hypothetical protein